LVKLRNALVHAKSTVPSHNSQSTKSASKKNQNLVVDADVAFRALCFLSLELTTLFGFAACVLPQFEIDWHTRGVLHGSENYRAKVRRIREIHARSVK
jgi:hypothetical protein